MPRCPGCGSDVRDGKPFCGKCGTSIPSEAPSSGGLSKIELDAQLINTLLTMFASKPGGPQVRLEGGQLRVQAGEVSVAVNPIRLQEAAQVLLRSGQLGNLNLSVDLLQLGEQGLEVQLRLT